MAVVVVVVGVVATLTHTQWLGRRTKRENPCKIAFDAADPTLKTVSQTQRGDN